MDQQNNRLLRFPSRQGAVPDARYQELVTRPWEMLSAEERIELSMLPNPTSSREDGSALARSLFRFTEQAGYGGMTLDELMVILAEPIRFYLLSCGYVREMNKVNPAGRTIRYVWSKQTALWEASFD